MKVFAHRGCCHLDSNTENTMIAFNNALGDFDGIETDLRLTKDNIIVLFHDDNFKRLHNINKKLIDCNYNQANKYCKNKLVKLVDFLLFIKKYNTKAILDIKEHSQYIINRIEILAIHLNI